jgi:hypothetical protein
MSCFAPPSAGASTAATAAEAEALALADAEAEADPDDEGDDVVVSSGFFEQLSQPARESAAMEAVDRKPRANAKRLTDDLHDARRPVGPLAAFAFEPRRPHLATTQCPARSGET